MSDSLKDKTKDQLINIIKELKKSKKFGLVWEDQQQEVASQCKQFAPVLSHIESKSITKTKSPPPFLN